MPQELMEAESPAEESETDEDRYSSFDEEDFKDKYQPRPTKSRTSSTTKVVIFVAPPTRAEKGGVLVNTNLVGRLGDVCLQVNSAKGQGRRRTNRSRRVAAETKAASADLEPEVEYIENDTDPETERETRGVCQTALSKCLLLVTRRTSNFMSCRTSNLM